jgi:hypothetical protein
MVEDETIMRRILASYKLMLDFYGMRLENEATGLISRSENYTARYRNLCGTCFYPDPILQLRPHSGWAGMSCRTRYASLRALAILSYPSVHFVRPMMNQ